MRILIVNKFFYPRGGDCIVAIATRQLLEEKGHEVRVFAMQHPDNIALPEMGDYAPQIDFSAGLSGKLRGAARVFGADSVKKAFMKVLLDFKPEVVHLHNIHSYLSPIIGQLAGKFGARVVWTLHDYKLLCPAYLFRTPEGENCEDCIRGRLHVAKKRCMKGNILQSLLGDLEARYWNHRKLNRFTDAFIAPSQFMRNKMMEGGFSPSKVKVVCNFVDPAKLAVLHTGAASPREDYFCYVGRLSEEKGSETLLRAGAEAGVNLKVAGTGPLEEELRKKFSKFPNIEFLGHLSNTEVARLLTKAKASILPSEWYENNPLGVIESLCAGTPVIGAKIGGIPELLTSENGILFSSGNEEELTKILKDFDIRHKFNHQLIADRAAAAFDRATHYRSLMSIYKPAVSYELTH